MKNNCFAHGKLLITGEYLVMEGAKALAVPLKTGQSLAVCQTETGLLEWKANAPGTIWFEAVFKLPSLEVVQTSDPKMSDQLKLLLLNADRLSNNFLKNKNGLSVTTDLGFYPEYGFGSSSTLVYCVAHWADIDSFLLQRETFGGSGYDIACADAKGPITYRISDNDAEIHRVDFKPSFRESIYFVYLGQKQQTAGSIRDFRRNASYSNADIDKISAITDAILLADKLEDFEILLNSHEQIMSRILGMPTVRSLHFPDNKGAVKSLGAWGGDFVLVTGRQSEKEFIRQMNSLGFNIIYPFNDLVLFPE